MMAKPYRMNRIGILNHEGGIWTPETFDSSEVAQAYIDAQQKRWPSMDLSRHRPALVSVTLSVAPSVAPTQSESPTQ